MSFLYLVFAMMALFAGVVGYISIEDAIRP